MSRVSAVMSVVASLSTDASLVLAFSSEWVSSQWKERGNGEECGIEGKREEGRMEGEWEGDWWRHGGV